MNLRRCFPLLFAAVVSVSVGLLAHAAPKRTAKAKPLPSIAAGPNELAVKPAAVEGRMKKIGAVQLELVMDTAKVEAGKPFLAGVHFRIEPKWDIYWQFEGGIGQPTSVEWELPAGFKAGPLRWPLPRAHDAATGDLNFIYQDEVLIFAEITPPAILPAGPLAIKAKVAWQMCNEEKCFPTDASLELPLLGGEVRVPDAELFAKWQTQLPGEGPPPFRVLWDRSKADAVKLRIEGLGREYRMEFFPLPVAVAKPGQPPEAPLAMIKPGRPAEGPPTADGARMITIPVAENGAPNLPWRGVLVRQKEGGGREGWLIAAEGGVSANLVEKPLPPKSGALIWKLLAAFLGGLIMNVMPCVLPVIALKIFGFVHQAGEEPRRVFRLGLAFTGGVFVFFLGLAFAVARLKTAFTWGYQFQDPYLLAGMIALVFVFALNLIGVFEISLGSGAASRLGGLSRRDGYGGAFLHGLFTTLLGTSCTAPFLGASVSFATTQSGPVIFALFLAIAAGMSLPYFLLTAKPAWLRYVPKPGAWMERVKQGMGFLMLAVAVWLFTVLALNGAAAMTAMSWCLLALGLACWLFGTFRESRTARAAAALLPLGAYFLFIHGKLDAADNQNLTERTWKTGSIEWVAYTDERLAEARQGGRPVFIDFTAEWCINCKTFEQFVLGTEPVGAKFRAKKVAALRADWTNRKDPVVTRALKSYGSAGVPLYVLYRPGETEPVVLDAITTGTVLAELEKIKN